MLTQKKLEKLSLDYKLSKNWDNKVNIVRKIYDLSEKEDRKFNLTIFGELVGKDFQYLYTQGQLELYNIQKRQKKYKQDVSFQTAKKNLERRKNPSVKRSKENIKKMFEEEIEVKNITKFGKEGGKNSRKNAQIYQSL